MKAINIKVYPNDASQLENLKALMKAFKIKFKVVEEKNYDPEFVKKILEARDNAKQGKSVTIPLEDLWK